MDSANEVDMPININTNDVEVPTSIDEPTSIDAPQVPNIIDANKDINIAVQQTNNNIQEMPVSEMSSIVSLYDDALNLFIENNKYDILNTLYDLFVEYINNNIIYMYLETFESDMIYDATQLCAIIMSDQFPSLDFDSLNESITFNEYITTSLKLLHTEHIPKRAYTYSFIRKELNKELIKNKIEYIRNKDQPEQRTDEWYAYRSNLITASNAWKIFDSECNRNSIIYEKCMVGPSAFFENHSFGF